MITLTDRLQILANSIEKGETMADIGTDHGFLPLYLWENGISPSVVMCDISEPSLDKARFAASAYSRQEGLYFRAGDGLKVLEKAQVDAVVIAGMGGLLMIDILSDDMEKTSSFSKFVLQPRNNAAKLRLWLSENGFKITEEHLVREGKYICEILVAKPCNISDAPVSIDLTTETDPKWEIPELMLSEDGKLVAQLAFSKAEIEERVVSGLKKSNSMDKKRIELCENRLKFFRSIANES